MADIKVLSRRRLLGVSLIALFYMVLRALIYHWFKVDSYEAWVRRDFLMNLPRALCLGGTLWFGLKNWKIIELGFFKKGFGIGIIFLFGELTLKGLIGGLKEGPAFQGSEFFYLATGSIFVGFFEEILFRGVMLRAISDWLGVRMAIVGSSFLFMLFHWQAQDLASWPFLFLFGCLNAGLRQLEVSVIALAITHAIFDTLYFYFKEIVPGSVAYFGYNFFYLVFAVGLFCFSVTLGDRKSSPVGRHLNV